MFVIFILLEFEVFFKIYVFNLFIFEDLLWCIMSDKVFLIDNICVFVDCEGFMDVMVGNQNVEIVVVQVFNDVFNIDNGDWIYVGKGFIQKNKFWICCQCVGDFDVVVFIIGECLIEVVVQVFNMKFFYQFFSVIFLLFVGQIVMDLQDCYQVVIDVEVMEN